MKYNYVPMYLTLLGINLLLYNNGFLIIYLYVFGNNIQNTTLSILTTDVILY